jgi:hypothetical protein
LALLLHRAEQEERMSRRNLGSALAVAIALAGAAELRVDAQDKDVKLTGCVVRGEDGDGYLLTNGPGEPAWQRSADANVSPGAVGTSGAFATVFYWLDEDDELEKHVGHFVEVEGEVEGDLEDGEIKIDRKDDWTEIEVESDGDHLKARVPHSSVFAAPGRDSDRNLNVLVRRVDVERVKLIDAACRR